MPKWAKVTFNLDSAVKVLEMKACQESPGTKFLDAHVKWEDG